MKLSEIYDLNVKTVNDLPVKIYWPDNAHMKPTVKEKPECWLVGRTGHCKEWGYVIDRADGGLQRFSGNEDYFTTEPPK